MIRDIACRPLRRITAALLLLVAVLCPACDQSIVDPALASGDDEALLRAAGLERGGGQHTLGVLVLDAANQTRRELGHSAATELLRPVATGQARVQEAERIGAAAEVERARAEVRAAQLAIATATLGGEGIARVVSRIGADVAFTTAALDSAAARGKEVGALRARHAQALETLAAARVALADTAWVVALDAATRAAEQLVQVGRGLLELERVPALSELYRRAERALTAAQAEFPDGGALLLRHAELQDAARIAVASGNREQAHAALTAVREDELQFTLRVLGPECATGVVTAVGAAVEELQATHSPEPRLRRMLAAASDLHARAHRALAAGDAVAALDLGSYAAGLINAYRLASSRL